MGPPIRIRRLLHLYAMIVSLAQLCVFSDVPGDWLTVDSSRHMTHINVESLVCVSFMLSR